MANFIVMGAVKAGTTSLFHYLSQHPEIQMSRNNWPRYFHIDGGDPDFKKLASEFGQELFNESVQRYNWMFHKNIDRSFGEYLKQWPSNNYENNIKKGEVSPTYIHDSSTFEKIKKRLPNVKLVVILRQPADRAFSHYVMDRAKGWLPQESFATALEKEPIDSKSFWWGSRHYIRSSMYAENVRLLQEVFDQSQLKFLLHEDFSRHPDLILAEICQFIGVDDRFLFDSTKKHNEGLWRVPAKGDVSDHSNMRIVKPKLDPSFRLSFTETFSSNISSLQELIHRDLSVWLE